MKLMNGISSWPKLEFGFLLLTEMGIDFGGFSLMALGPFSGCCFRCHNTGGWQNWGERFFALRPKWFSATRHTNVGLLYRAVGRSVRTKFRILIEIFRERFDPGLRLPIRGWWKKKSRTLLLNLFLSRVAIFAQNITIICFSEWAIWCTKTEIERELC